jgi:hypothetical protein
MSGIQFTKLDDRRVTVFGDHLTAVEDHGAYRCVFFVGGQIDVKEAYDDILDLRNVTKLGDDGRWEPVEPF